MTPEQFTACVKVLADDPAEFVVRALIHAADALQQTQYAEGGALIIEKLAGIQAGLKPRPEFTAPRPDTVSGGQGPGAL